MRLVVVTGSRAEWGLLEPLVDLINYRHNLELIATGSHLSKHHGYTKDEIDYPHTTIEILLANDSPVSTSKAMGLGVISFAEVYERINPDAVVLLGDRYEILSAAIAAHVAQIPIVHIHGGETTEGAIDNAFRHSITHMASLHFVSAEPYRRKVLGLGAKVDSVFNVGSLGCDGLEFVKDKDDYILAVWHPVTAGSEFQFFEGLRGRKEEIYFIQPNSDPGNIDISYELEWVAEGFLTPSKIFDSLPRPEFLDLLSNAKCIIGNSSAGIIEAPCLGTPTINVGSRQKGRLKAFSVIDCDCDKESIKKAFRRLEEPGFQAIVKGGKWTRFYEGGDVAQKIIRIIEDRLS